MTIVERKIAVFDFDGTLTNKDTFVEFIKFVFGIYRWSWGFFLYSPILIAMKLHLYSNSKAKERVFSHFFRGMDYGCFKKYCEAFSSSISSMVNANTLDMLKEHLRQGHKVYIVSASIYEWVAAWSRTVRIERVLSTCVEVSEKGLLTGCFSTPNCYGEEKVRRFLTAEPDRESYELYAYGDSRGDKEMLALADHAYKIS